MSWSPEGDLKFGVFSKNGKQLNYVGMGSTHTPDTLRAILSGVLNSLAKITSRKTYFRYERVDNVYPDHVSVLHKSGLATPIFLTMGKLWKGQDENWILIMKNNLKSTKKNRNVYFCVS